MKIVMLNPRTFVFVTPNLFRGLFFDGWQILKKSDRGNESGRVQNDGMIGMTRTKDSQLNCLYQSFMRSSTDFKFDGMSVFDFSER